MNQGPRPTFGVHARGLEVICRLHRRSVWGDGDGGMGAPAAGYPDLPSRQALVDQIERDAVAARAILKG